MPEAVRTFAHERHRRHGGGTTPTAAFVRWAVTTAQRIDELSRGPQELAADSKVRSELGNLRSAHRSAIGSDDITSAVAITVALDRVASFRDLPEVWSWARTLAVLPAIDVHPRRADVFGAAAEAAWLTGDLDDAERLASRGLAGDGDCGRCHYALATVALFRGELDRARQSFLVAADADRTVLANAALAAAYAGDQPGALALLEQGIPWARASGGPTDLAVFEYATGETLAGSPDAGTHYERAIALARHSGASFVEGVASVGLASTLAERGQVGEALGLHRRTVRYWARTGNWTQQWITLRNVTRLLRSLGDDAVADVLDAAVARSDEEGATTEAAPIVMTERTPRSAVVARALDAIGAHLPS
jgi:tetratricopeptide (TPR) repeat protein